MGMPLLVVGSITNAMKGKEILNKNGFKATIQRAPQVSKQNSCGYGILVPDKVEEAKKLLINNKIEVKRIITVDAT